MWVNGRGVRWFGGAPFGSEVVHRQCSGKVETEIGMWVGSVERRRSLLACERNFEVTEIGGEGAGTWLAEGDVPEGWFAH
jgi:hypothetical protein